MPTSATTSAGTSAPTFSSASGEGGAAPTLVNLSPMQVPMLSITSMNMPVVLFNPLTRGPLLLMQAGSLLLSHVPPTQQPLAQVHMSFHYSYCGIFNFTVGQSSEVFYVVTAGSEYDKEVVQPLVLGVIHACHKKYKTHTLGNTSKAKKELKQNTFIVRPRLGMNKQVQSKGYFTFRQSPLEAA
ncbi:hypothetical protein ARMGADRAFT_1037948 [Armillaria gallica]|uniref:Uncharacterized protein n=1 Tax=Armillaria gallica TaxID=47427 RepID=A0A2H3CXW4_ARMGA|nr:hypothetical protein ARMGADRAFT_1037948 [Armillaria gallica]